MDQSILCFGKDEGIAEKDEGQMTLDDERDNLTGQIIRLYADVATVQLEEGTVECAIRGKLFKVDPPAVGDRVRLARTKGAVAGAVGGLEASSEKAAYTIVEVLPRKSVLERRAAGSQLGGSPGRKQVMIANIDHVIVVFAAARPDPVPAKLDRFLVVAESNDLQAQIVINKMDLAEDEAATRKMFRPYEEAGYRVHYTSVKRGDGLEGLRSALRRKVSVLVGSSGVGKSSLLNALYPGLNLKVGEIIEAYGKGRHTTVGGYLIRLPDGAAVADTAGLREIGLWMIPPEDLPHCFPEMRPLLTRCRFNDCAHLKEPGCAIIEAVERREIHVGRYDSYVKLRMEATETFPRW